MNDLLHIAQALSDRNRVRIVAVLRHGELCVCQIVELLQLAHSTVSKHLSILASAGLAESRKEGRWIYYRLPRQARSLAARTMRLVSYALEADQTIREDKALLAKILRMDAEKLCSIQMQKRRG